MFPCSSFNTQEIIFYRTSSMSNRRSLLILGMHRSGTSAESGLLERVGVDFGKAVVTPSFDNPKGFFENYRVQDLIDEILLELISSWDDLVSLPDNWLKIIENRGFVEKAKRIIQKEYKSVDLFAIKDPYISLLYPVLASCI